MDAIGTGPAGARGPLVAKSYRTDVQGLRAFGIVLVILFHLWFGKVSGGVDVFFVVSAYLMTTSLLASFDKTGKVDILGFWGRIALRILPTAALVLFATLVLGALIVPISTWKAFGQNALASVLQVENLHLMRQATDYLARGTPASPFQQFWALSIQMQFYVGLPILIFGCACISRHLLRQSYSVAVHSLVAAGLAILSFGFALWILSISPAPHYFNTAARLWEFMVGSICALAAGRLSFGRTPALLLGWLGFAMILSCGVVIPVSAPFPGVAALLPVTGAALVLLTGARDQGPGSVGRFLSGRFLQLVAEISFALYLWHWPIMVFVQEWSGSAQLDFGHGLLVILLATIAATLTKWLVEDPARGLSRLAIVQHRPKWVRTAFPFAVAITLLAPSLAFVSGWNRHHAALAHAYIVQAQAENPRALDKLTHWDTHLPADIDAKLTAIKSYTPNLYGRKCSPSAKSPDLILCVDGDRRDDAYTVVLTGGSHSIQWHPALADIAARRGWRLISIVKSACPIDGAYIAVDQSGPEVRACRTWAARALARIMAIRPDMVVTTATRPGDDNVGDLIPDRFPAIWQRLADAGIAVAALRDNPRAEHFDMPACIDRHRPDPSACNLDRASHLSVPSPLDRYVAPSPRISLIDLSDYICTPRICPAMVDGMILYQDNSHLSVPFVRSLTAILEQKLLAVVAANRSASPQPVRLRPERSPASAAPAGA